MADAHYQNQDINKTVGTVLDVPCIECKRDTKHRVLASVDSEGDEDCGGGNHVQYGAKRQIVQCQGCEAFSFRTATWNSEDYDIDDENRAVINEQVTLFPSRTEGRVAVKDTYLLSPSIQRIYGETIGALNNVQPVLAGIGIRALVETICKDKQAPGKNLEQRIDGLVGQGVLTPDGAAILHKIRTLGNEAAHEVKPHKPEQLSLALDVIEHLMKGVYLLPHYAKETL